MSDAEAVAIAQNRYARAAHAIQTGVKLQAELMPGKAGTQPWSLRVGTNMALVDNGALAGLLLKKGLITDLEYAEALAAGCERERDRIAAELSAHLGRQVHLA